MIASQTLSLSEPAGTANVALSTFIYFRKRLKQRIFNALLKEYVKSGVTKIELARRLDKDPATVSRLLAGPGNLTLDTVSDVLFALSGAELSTSVEYPLRKTFDGKVTELKQLTSTDKITKLDLSEADVGKLSTFQIWQSARQISVEQYT